MRNILAIIITIASLGVLVYSLIFLNPVNNLNIYNGFTGSKFLLNTSDFQFIVNSDYSNLLIRNNSGDLSLDINKSDNPDGIKSLLGDWIKTSEVDNQIYLLAPDYCSNLNVVRNVEGEFSYLICTN